MIDIEGLTFRYPRSAFRLRVDHLSIAAGEKVALVGPSGSGKTTLLHLITGILTAEQGVIRVADRLVSAMPDRARRNFRITQIGLIFQRFDLIEYLSVRDNILLPFYVNNALENLSQLSAQAVKLAESLGLSDKLNRWIHQLSQGEQQRVAVARALLTRPPLLLGDEPTGSLDPANKRRIIELMFEHANFDGATLLMVTHDMAILDGFDRVIDVQQFHAGDS